MNIAIYHNLGTGGAKKALYNMVAGLHSRGHQIDVFTTSLADHDFYDIRPLVHAYHIEHVHGMSGTGLRGRLALLMTIHRLRTAERRIAQVINHGAYDVALVTNCRIIQHPHLLRELTIPTVLYTQEVLRSVYDQQLISKLQTAFNPPAKKLLTPIGLLLERAFSARWASIDSCNVRSIAENNILVNSYFSRESFIRAYGLAPTVCYLGTDVPHEPILPHAARVRRVISVGGLEPHKGHDWVIRAVALIDSAHRPEVAVIGDRGSASYATLLTDLGKRLGVTVTIHRGISDADMAGFYHSSLLSVCAQWMEPFGLVPIESQAHGTPVVAVREGGLRETVLDGVGGIICDRDERQLAHAISLLVTDTDRWDSLSEKGALFVSQTFTWQKAVDTIEHHLDMCMSRKEISTKHVSTPPVTGGTDPLVYAILLNWNGISDTTDCIRSLQSMQYRNMRILVVDNASQHNEADELHERFGNAIELIRNSNNDGFAKGNNGGIHRALAAGADYVLLINNDTTISPNSLRSMVLTAQKHHAGIVSPIIYRSGSNEVSAAGGSLDWSSRFIAHHGTTIPTSAQPQSFVTGCCLLISKDLLSTVGMLDERYFLYYEDVDFCLRTARAGFSIFVDPTASVWHKISQSTVPESPTYHYYITRNKLLLCRKNASLLIFWYHYIRTLLTAAYCALRVPFEKDIKQRRRMTAILRGTFDFTRGAFYDATLHTRTTPHMLSSQKSTS